MSRVLSDKIVAELNACGAPWRVEDRRKHLVLILAERLVTVLPRTARGRRNRTTVANVEAGIRRAIRGIK